MEATGSLVVSPMPLEAFIAAYPAPPRLSEEQRIAAACEVISLIGGLMMEYGIKSVDILGSTPSFNDGDPCTHSQSVYVNKRESYGSLGPSVILGERAANRDAGEHEEGIKDVVDSIFKALKGTEGPLYLALDTGWHINISNDGGEIKYKIEDYWSEY